MPEERLAVFLHVVADSGPAAGHLEVAPAPLGGWALVRLGGRGLPRQRPFKQMRSRVGVVLVEGRSRSHTAFTPAGSGAANSSARRVPRARPFATAAIAMARTTLCSENASQ